MVLMVLTSCGTISQSNVIVNNGPVPSTVQNTVPVTVGPNLAGFPNGIFTSVTVCDPAVYPVGQNPLGGPPLTQSCQTIDNILVDTGSVGLRLLESAAVDNLALPVVTDSNNHTLHECVQFADLSYVWGTVAWATIQMAGETASQAPFVYDPANPENGLANTGIPIQIITSPVSSPTAVPADCLSSSVAGGTPIAADSLQTLGANGILGVGSFLQDCGSACTSTPPRNQYYYCPSNLCSVASVPLDLQLWNPVAALAYDNNGLLLTLPFPAEGASGPITGSLIFGNGTQSDNALGQAEISAIDAYGNFPEVTLTEPSPISPSFPPVLFVSYLSPKNGSYIDTGSPAFYFSDAQSLAIPECPGANGKALGLYCPAAVSSFSAQVYGTNKAQKTISWNIDNAAALLNSGNSVFTALGGDSGIDLATDYVVFGLPFFLGNKVFVGFAGTTAFDPQGQLLTYPNGYWAF
jgi:hypothetical protein